IHLQHIEQQQQQQEEEHFGNEFSEFCEEFILGILLKIQNISKMVEPKISEKSSNNKKQQQQQHQHQHRIKFSKHHQQLDQLYHSLHLDEIVHMISHQLFHKLITFSLHKQKQQKGSSFGINLRINKITPILIEFCHVSEWILWESLRFQRILV